MDVTLEKGERIEDLQCKGLKIIQNKNYYTFTSDSVILANFINLKKDDFAIEIGTGCGVISVLLSAKVDFKKIVAFELQDKMAHLAEKNVLLNDLQDKIQIISDDAKNFKDYIDGYADVVFSNPPYMHESSLNKNDVKSIARHDSTLPLADLCKIACQMLKFGGKFYMTFPASRCAEAIHTLIENGLEPKRMFFTENNKREIKLIVIEAVKGARHGVKVLPNLVTNDIDGQYLKILQTRYFLKNEK